MPVFLPLLPLYRGFLYGGYICYPYYIRGLIWLYMGVIYGGYIWGGVLAFALVLVHWVLVSPLVLLVLRVGFLLLSLRCGGLPFMALYRGLPLPLSIGHILLNVCGYAVNKALYWLLVALSFCNNAIDSGATGDARQAAKHTPGGGQAKPPTGGGSGLSSLKFQKE